MMETLPTEILLKIFDHLSETELIYIEAASSRFSDLIVENYWSQELERLSEHDVTLVHELRKSGLPTNVRHRLRCHDLAESEKRELRSLVRSLYKKLVFEVRETWHTDDPRVVTSVCDRAPMFTQYDRDQNKVLNVELYHNRIFLGYQGGLIKVLDADDFREVSNTSSTTILSTYIYYSVNTYSYKQE